MNWSVWEGDTEKNEREWWQKWPRCTLFNERLKVLFHVRGHAIKHLNQQNLFISTKRRINLYIFFVDRNGKWPKFESRKFYQTKFFRDSCLTSHFYALCIRRKNFTRKRYETSPENPSYRVSKRIDQYLLRGGESCWLMVIKAILIQASNKNYSFLFWIWKAPRSKSRIRPVFIRLLGTFKAFQSF